MDKTTITLDEAQALGAVFESETQILFETRHTFTHFFQTLQLIGIVTLFMVLSALGIGPGKGSAPEMSGQSTALAFFIGVLLIGVGIGLQSICKYYTVLDLRQKKFFSQLRLFKKVVRHETLINFNQIVSVGINRRSTGVNTDFFINYLRRLVDKSSRHEPENAPGADDNSLVVLSRNAKIHELTSFRNGTKHFELAKSRGQFIAEILNLSLILCNQGNTLQPEKIANRLILRPVSRNKQAMRPQRLTQTVLSWGVFILFLLIIFFWAMSTINN